MGGEEKLNENRIREGRGPLQSRGEAEDIDLGRIWTWIGGEMWDKKVGRVSEQVSGRLCNRSQGGP